MTVNEKEVIRKIIYAVETGDQIYGQARYDDFTEAYTEAYTNSDDEHAVTIGAGQWFADEARQLLMRIRSCSPDWFDTVDKAGLSADIDAGSWDRYQISGTSQKAECIRKIIDSQIGHACQDMLMDEEMEAYIHEAEELGVTDMDAGMMCANFRHQGGYSAMARILGKTLKPYSLDNLYAASKTDTGNQVGAYTERQTMVYESLKKYLNKPPSVRHGQKAVDLAVSRKGKNQYTQSERRIFVFDGYSDCSSLVWKCFEQAYGIYVGSWTGEQVEHGKMVTLCKNRGSYGRLSKEEISRMQPGDCIYYGSGEAKHVEMYIGNGRQIGHGSGTGPTVKNCLEYGHPSGVYQIRRFVPDDNPSDPYTPDTWIAIGTAVSTADNVNVRETPSGDILRTVN
ncbi:MAG: NlpC/P60 family protein [Eubacteriales bacterium]|nr:NlpC/P60 family protein [Eubacteriales bacterium]